MRRKKFCWQSWRWYFCFQRWHFSCLRRILRSLANRTVSLSVIVFYFFSCFLFSSLTEILIPQSNNNFSLWILVFLNKSFSCYPLNAKKKFTVFENRKFALHCGKSFFFHFLENINNYGCRGNCHVATCARAFFRFFSVKRALKRLHLNTKRSYITRLRCSACQSQIPTDDQCSHLIGLFTQV